MPRYISSTTPPTTTEPFEAEGRSGLSDAITGVCYSDVSGTLYVDQSINGTNWDFTTTEAITGGTGVGFKKELYAPFYRIRFVPATDGDEFRIAVRHYNAGRT